MAHTHSITRIGDLLVSTVFIPNDAIRGDHWETMVFQCDDRGRVVDWTEKYALFTANEAVGHENGKAWARQAVA